MPLQGNSNLRATISISKAPYGGSPFFFSFGILSFCDKKLLEKLSKKKKLERR